MKKIRSKFLCAFCLFCVLCAPVAAQDAVNFEFSDGISNVALKKRMETQLSRLLTAINQAYSRDGDINFTGIDLADLASQSITSLWANAHFQCLDNDIVEHCLQMRRNGRLYGYQVRNIAVEMKPVDDAYTDDLNQEICVDFDTKGRISDVNITMGLHQFTNILKTGMDLVEGEERMTIIKFCEYLANAYVKKDTTYLENVYSDDALIVTGKKIVRTKPEFGLAQSDVILDVIDKPEYMRRLKNIFRNPKTGRVNVNFADYKVKAHPTRPHFYYVTLTQKWATNTYNDEGIVFLLWDFRDREKPKIQVRTWLPIDTPDETVERVRRDIRVRESPSK